MKKIYFVIGAAVLIAGIFLIGQNNNTKKVDSPLSNASIKIGAVISLTGPRSKFWRTCAKRNKFSYERN